MLLVMRFLDERRSHGPPLGGHPFLHANDARQSLGRAFCEPQQAADPPRALSSPSAPSRPTDIPAILRAVQVAHLSACLAAGTSHSLIASPSIEASVLPSGLNTMHCTA